MVTLPRAAAWVLANLILLAGLVFMPAHLFADGLSGFSSQHNAELGREDATPSRLATQRLLLASAKAGSRIVAAGEFGHILYSENNGKSWTQAAEVPTQTTLTSLYFVDEKRGYAGGHDSTLLATDDGGVHWRLIYRDETQLVPVLSLFFENENHGFAVGAFSLFLETQDGGKSWIKRSLIEGEDGDSHLNDIFADTRGTIFIAAEFGEIYRSTDHGESFSRIRTNYEGSFWGGLALRDGASLVYGMGGKLYRSTNGGLYWKRVNSGTDQSIQDGVELQNGTIVLVGLQGYVGFSDNGGMRFTATAEADRQGLASVIETAPGRVAVFGRAGVRLRPGNPGEATGKGQSGPAG